MRPGPRVFALQADEDNQGVEDWHFKGKLHHPRTTLGLAKQPRGSIFSTQLQEMHTSTQWNMSHHLQHVLT